MARFLFVVPPFAGHVNPTVGVAGELSDLGHEVAWAAHPSAVRPLLPPGADLLPLDEGVDASLLASLQREAHSVRGLSGLKFLWERVLIPLARGMEAGVEEAVRAFRPDVLAVDQQALAGAVVARRLGVPWATLATTSAGITDPLEGLPKVRDWIEGLLDGLRRDAGLEGGRLDRSDHLVLVFSTRALVGQTAPFPKHLHFVGPSLGARGDPSPFPWEALEPRRRILVSLGTVNAERGGRFFRVVAEAVASLDVQAVLVAPPELAPQGSARLLVRPRVPQLELLPRVDAVVCHAGHNTVCETLAEGLPLVVAPITDDQPVIADQVVRAGAGLRVRFGRVRGPELARAIARVLDEPAFREAAERIKASFAEAGGAPRAASLLAELAAPRSG